jgi:hypothetical protein
MGRHTGSSTQRESSISRTKQPHEIWRGIGCLMMVIVPVISVAAASETVKWILANGNKLIPRALLGIPRLPDFVYKSDGLVLILSPITKINNLYAIVVMSLFYILIISGVISVIYAATYNMVGPSRYGPTDAPPPKIKRVKKSR